jgi:hypothetical protein
MNATSAITLVILTLAQPLHAASTWKAIKIEPRQITLANPGASQRFVISATDASGREMDSPADTRVVSSNPQVAVVDPKSGTITAKSSGRAVITASRGRMSSSVQVEVRNQPGDVAVRFSPDVVSILTIKGCNSSGCHGSPAGQNGFKLSLFGYNVDADHEMIVKAHGGRRVNIGNPQQSLLLAKPSFQIPHGGGKVLPHDSEEYRTVLNWLKQGAPVQSGGAQLTGLELYPSERVMAGAGSRQRLAVIGRLSDGTSRDMTREVRFTVVDDTIASVSQDGVLTGSSTGLTAVLARAMGQVAAAQFGIISAMPEGDYPRIEANNFIDTQVFAKLRKMNIAPFPLTSDREFVRRVYLDAIGTLPTEDEARTFVEDSRADKRARLVDALLERSEYASFWTVKFEDWFRNCQLNSQGRSMGKFKEWLRERIAADRPYDQMVREVLTSQGDTFQNPAANFWHPATDFMLKKFDVNKVTPTVSRLFLGVRVECAECHNHPLENLTQDDFYGLSAFFAKMRVKHGYAEYRRTWYLDEEGEVVHPVTKKPVQPKLLGADRPQFAPGEDRRKVLAEWITSPSNPYFARATVNRIWQQYFDTGIVEPFDDFRSTNPPTNRELLDSLAQYLASNGFRLKPLHRLILNSRTYQLSSADSNGSREVGPLERLLFARYAPRKLPAEVLLDAVSQVTAVPHRFRNYPKGTRAIDIDVPDSPDYFLVAFGLPRRDVLTDRSKSPTLSQALHLMNGDTVMQKVQSSGNVLSGLLEKTAEDATIISQLYERAYARPPSAGERDHLLQYVAGERQAGRDRRRAFEGVLWAILNSKEFQLNH